MICGTKAMSTGINYGWVDGVFFAGAPDEVIEALQAIGRAARERQGGFCIIFLDSNWKVNDMQKYDALMGVEEKVMQRVLGGLECRAVAFSEFIDGIVWRCERIE
jgi:ERCC4-related helicase